MTGTVARDWKDVGFDDHFPATADRPRRKPITRAALGSLGIRLVCRGEDGRLYGERGMQGETVEVEA